MSQRPLDLLLPRNRQQMLAAVLMHPERWWYRSELAAQMGVPPSSLQRPLAALLASGLLRSRRHGNRLYFQANPDSPLFPELRGLMAKTIGLVDVLRGALAPLAAKIQVAFVYGSFARSAEVGTSDVDLFLVGTIGLAELSLPLRDVRAELGREVNPTLYSRSEFRAKVRARHHFVTSVLDGPKLFVVGTRNDLARAAHATASGAKALKPGGTR